MIEPNRIAAGVARNLLKRAGPNTDPKPLIEEAFRAAFGLASRCDSAWTKSRESSQGRAAPMRLTPDERLGESAAAVCVKPRQAALVGAIGDRHLSMPDGAINGLHVF